MPQSRQSCSERTHRTGDGGFSFIINRHLTWRPILCSPQECQWMPQASAKLLAIDSAEEGGDNRPAQMDGETVTQNFKFY